MTSHRQGIDYQIGFDEGCLKGLSQKFEESRLKGLSQEFDLMKAVSVKGLSQEFDLMKAV